MEVIAPKRIPDILRDKIEQQPDWTKFVESKLNEQKPLSFIVFANNIRHNDLTDIYHFEIITEEADGKLKFTRVNEQDFLEGFTGLKRISTEAAELLTDMRIKACQALGRNSLPTEPVV